MLQLPTCDSEGESTRLQTPGGIHCNHRTFQPCHSGILSDWLTQFVACVWVVGEQERGYRDLVLVFTDWCYKNMLLFNTNKTKRQSQPVSQSAYLGSLNWSANTAAIYKKGQSRLFFLRRLRKSFDVCTERLSMLYHTVIASALFCCGLLGRESYRNSTVSKAGSVRGNSGDYGRGVCYITP